VVPLFEMRRPPAQKQDTQAVGREDRSKHRWCGLLGLLVRNQMSLVAVNPVTNSEPPRPKMHLAIALAPKA
jgi:hypothetical protein